MATSLLSPAILPNSETATPKLPHEITNNITPPRRKLWSDRADDTLKSLPKGTSGCLLAIADSKDQAIWLHSDCLFLRRFRLGFLQGEALSEFYRLLGNKHISFNGDLDGATTSSRKKFFQSFLIPKKADMAEFLGRTSLRSDHDSCSVTIDDFLGLLDPSKKIKELNVSVHDVSKNDFYVLIQDVGVLDPSKLHVWIDICTRVLGETDITRWKDDESPIGPHAAAVRMFLANDPFVTAATNFEDVQQQNANVKFATSLTRKGILPSVTDVKLLQEENEKMKKLLQEEGEKMNKLLQEKGEKMNKLLQEEGEKMNKLLQGEIEWMKRGIWVALALVFLLAITRFWD